MFETGKGGASRSLITRRALPSHEISLVVLREFFVTLDEATPQSRLERDDHVDGVPPPINCMEDLLAVDFGAEDEWELWDIPLCGAIDVPSSLLGDVSAI